MFQKSKLTDWIIAGAVVYTAVQVVQTVQSVEQVIESVVDKLTRPAQVVREKLSPKKTKKDVKSTLLGRFFK